MNKPICAISGSNGYVGGCVKNYFSARGWEIFELTRRPKPGTRGMPFQLGQPVSPQLLSGIGTLVHCAYDFQPLRWDEIKAVNVEGSRKILEAARTAGIPKLIYISSISAYAGCRSLYGRAKLEIEKIAADNGALVVRPGLVYGSGPGGMFGKLAEQVRKSSVIPLIGDGSQIQYLVHNEDLSSFLERYASGQVTAPGAGPFTAAHPQPWPFKELLREMGRAMGRRPKFVPLPWRLVWLGLKTAETAGLRLNFRSDSLVSLMYQNPAPDFAGNAAVGLACRPFQAETLKL
ncbi:MAG TPA: NAD-dependent epimerase/dehydratase family protein [Desulfuromonadaceae bacterium]|nr:NAD-dependent epimerase/dehydratase family protein [Desulfuromonadaceae bacterium]